MSSESNNFRDGRTNTSGMMDLHSGERWAFLVELHGPNIGKPYELLKEKAWTLGRSDSADIAIEEQSLSRRHAVIKYSAAGRNWILEDLGSRNGTYVNGLQILRPVNLNDGDRVQLAHVLLQFKYSDVVEWSLHNKLYRDTLTDELTKLPNKKYLLEFLGRECRNSLQSDRPLSLAMFMLEQPESRSGPSQIQVADAVLHELAQVAKRSVEESDCLARYDGSVFVLAMLQQDPRRARHEAETLLRTLENTAIAVNGQSTFVKLRLGFASLTPQMSRPEDLLQAARSELTQGNEEHASGPEVQTTTDTTVVAKMNPVAVTRADRAVVNLRPIDGVALIRRILAAPAPGALVAFELSGESALAEVMGPRGIEVWNSELEQEIVRLLKPEESLGFWKNRYFLVALGPESSAKTGRAFARVIMDAWTRKPVPEHVRGILTRSLRTATLSPDEVLSHGERSLEFLVTELLDDPNERAYNSDTRQEMAQSHLGRLPFPLEGPLAQVDAQATEHARAHTVANAMNVMIRFVASIGIALLRDHADEPTRAAGIGILQQYSGRRLSFDEWSGFALKISSLVSKISGHPVAAALRKLPATISPLDYIGFRQAVAALNENAYLVSVAGVEPFSMTGDADDSKIRYRLYSHQGASARFHMIHVALDAKLTGEWCYLLVPGAKPLCLAPIVRQQMCERCNRLEVFMAEQLVLGPPGAPVSFTGVTSGHEALATIPPFAS
ncbi:GGDEF domain-containing protein [Hyalangium versicolor]|uniref:GGDEF domain-containing protein n=1 Tax=Hyalangium versicolor TaxID=2861190 RepID=UPI001CCCF995|nr:GGDEF domain-containing protein [Hyalangium versicolor]